tara:strand:+ start:613 stop:1284 length:672 start_codon:yes stop_codon:yes gene_type:complete
MVVAFGCSFTFGDGLDNLPRNTNFNPQDLWDNKKENKPKPSDKSYPYLIGKLLKCNVENHGWRGGSNDMIFRKFFDHLFNNDKSTTYIIQWTFPYRSEIWHSKGNYFWGILSTFVGKFFKDEHGNKFEADKFSRRYYEEHFNETESKNKLLRYMWSVDGVCEKFGYQVIQLLPLGKKYVDFENQSLPKTLLDIEKITNLVNFEMHPTKDGHERLAEYITRRIK